TANAGMTYIGTSISLVDADEDLDGALVAVQADVDANEADADATQAELDVTQVGAGLNTDGTYTADGATNYITAATSLANADFLLDAVIKSNEDDNSNLQTEVDAIETGAGLDTDGNYIVPSGSNYLDGTSSLANADLTLDTELKGVQDELDVTQVGAGLGADGSYTANAGMTYIGTSISLVDADEDLDGALVAVQSDVDANEADADATQAELDVTQTGAGLDADGGYTAAGGTTYLGSATSLFNADVLLDAAIGANASDYTAIQTEVDAIETGAGLDTDGNYIVPSGSNYLDATTSLANADLTLDTELKGVQDELDVTQVGAGLGADGSYTANAGMTYIG
ncbi:MAG: hypothetical protein LC650_05910, partial [Actinobacteria bacterium]|nr:hypothetical protein [Actinomycetota bacterium]